MTEEPSVLMLLLFGLLWVVFVLAALYFVVRLFFFFWKLVFLFIIEFPFNDDASRKSLAEDVKELFINFIRRPFLFW